jgi:hypothetical protein
MGRHKHRRPERRRSLWHGWEAAAGQLVCSTCATRHGWEATVSWFAKPTRATRRNISDDAMRTHCDVLSKSESQAVWNAGGVPSHGKPNAWSDNHYQPEYFNDKGCQSCNGKPGTWPVEFKSIDRIRIETRISEGRRSVMWRQWTVRSALQPPSSNDVYDEIQTP